MNKKNQLVSVIIPTYGGSNSLKNAIDSVLEQSYENIEIIVVDDNQSNSQARKNTETIMRPYLKNNRVKYIKHSVNKNGSAARNTGFQYSKGKYVAFLDDDDICLKNKIELQIKALEKTDNNFCSCFYYKNGKKEKFKIKKDYTKDILMMNKTPQTSSFVLTRSLYEELNGFDETYERHQDYEFLIRVCRIAKIIVVNNYLYIRKGNVIENRPKASKMEYIKDKLIADFKQDIVNKKLNIKKIKAKNYSYIAMLYIKEKNCKKALSLFKRYGNIKFIYYLLSLIINNLIKKIRTIY